MVDVELSVKIGQLECQRGEIFVRQRGDGSVYLMVVSASPWNMWTVEKVSPAATWAEYHALAVAFGESGDRKVPGCRCVACVV